MRHCKLTRATGDTNTEAYGPEMETDMTENKFGTLVRLADTGETIADKDADIRGHKVLDKHGDQLGKIDALLVDDKEFKVRFIEVASGGLLGLGQQKSLIPVDAITEITQHEVHIDQTKGRVADAPAYDPMLVRNLNVYPDTYNYYGYLPYWGAEYIYPTFPSDERVVKARL